VAAGAGNYDIYVVFVERGLGFLKPTGLLGFILPHKFFNAQYGRPLRQLLSEGRHLNHIVYFGDQQVFANATTYTCLMFLTKSASSHCAVVKVKDLAAWRAGETSIQGAVESTQIAAGEWNFRVGNGSALFNKLSEAGAKLGELAERIGQGIRTSANEIYVVDVLSTKARIVEARSAQTNEIIKLERDAVTWFLQGREIKKYRTLSSGKAVLIPYRLQAGRAVLIQETEYQHKYQREKGRMRGDNWYAYIYPKNIDLMEMPKILVPDIADRAAFALDEDGSYAFTSGYGITLKAVVPESLKYVLGLLNSQVLNFFLKRVSTPLRGGFFRYFTQFVGLLPIRRIDFSDAPDRDRHERMVTLVEKMLSMHKRLSVETLPQRHEQLQREIAATDRQIDQLVYELYGLSAEEIRIVEEATG